MYDHLLDAILSLLHYIASRSFQNTLQIPTRKYSCGWRTLDCHRSSDFSVLWNRKSEIAALGSAEFKAACTKVGPFPHSKVCINSASPLMRSPTVSNSEHVEGCKRQELSSISIELPRKRLVKLPLLVKVKQSPAGMERQQGFCSRSHQRS